jgi:hypothetical protein
VPDRRRRPKREYSGWRARLCETDPARLSSPLSFWTWPPLSCRQGYAVRMMLRAPASGPTALASDCSRVRSRAVTNCNNSLKRCWHQPKPQFTGSRLEFSTVLMEPDPSAHQTGAPSHCVRSVERSSANACINVGVRRTPDSCRKSARAVGIRIIMCARRARKTSATTAVYAGLRVRKRTLEPQIVRPIRQLEITSRFKVREPVYCEGARSPKARRAYELDGLYARCLEMPLAICSSE